MAATEHRTTRAEPATKEAPLERAHPQNLEAEEHVLGAMMLAAHAIDAVRPILQPRDFYRESHGRMYRAALDLRDAGVPVDAITLADELDKRGELLEAGGKDRVREIATIVPTAANAATYAQKVVEAAQLRDLVTAGERISRLGWDRGAPTPELLTRAKDIAEGLQQRDQGAPIDWLTHQQVLELEAATERHLIDDLIPAGAVGTIAGVPETHKSWLAQAIAIRVARGQGWVLGKEICAQGPVGYLWQDDSTREEAERVKAFEVVHPNPAELPILWGLNLGFQLPRDIQRLRQTVTTNHLILLVLDSFYNFLPGTDLKDEAAEQVVSQLKREIADTTGCTILIVDHMPWATETNRGRLRAYGGVFKNAATRFGIYIDAISDKLHIEARGNNIKGIQKRLAYWDADTLELKLLTDQDVTAEDLTTVRAERALEWLQEHPGWHSTSDIRKGVGGNATRTDDALTLLLADQTIRDGARNGGPWNGKPGSGRYWTADEPSTSSAHHQTRLEDPDEVHSNTTDTATQPRPDEPDEVRTRSEEGQQGSTSSGTPASPPLRGEAPRDEVAAPDRLTDHKQWIDQGGWAETPFLDALLAKFPTLGPHDLPALEAHRATREQREFGGDTT